MNLRLCVSILFACLTALRSEGQARPPIAGRHPDTACRACHTTERPAPGDAALSPCVRVIPPGTHSADEGPDRITINERAEHYGRVVFPHKAHAEMSAMGSGCIGCHHEATEVQPIRRCSACHSSSRLRDDVDIPDLRGALHQQCSVCHQKLDPTPRCVACHVEGPGAAAPPRDAPPKAASAFPARLLYKFHKSMACDTCHKRTGEFKTPGRSCASCHTEFQKTFDHSKTGLTLNDTHREVSCADCHGAAMTFAEPPSCASCHDDKSYPRDKPGTMDEAPARPVLP